MSIQHTLVMRQCASSPLLSLVAPRAYSRIACTQVVDGLEPDSEWPLRFPPAPDVCAVRRDFAPAPHMHNKHAWPTVARPAQTRLFPEVACYSSLHALDELHSTFPGSAALPAKSRPASHRGEH